MIRIVVVIDSCHGLGLSRVMRVTGQLNDGSRAGSRVTQCDPLSALKEEDDNEEEDADDLLCSRAVRSALRSVERQRRITLSRTVCGE